MQPLVDSETLAYLVRLADTDEQRVVKFALTYGTEVHDTLAAERLAPCLYGTKRLPGGFVQVSALCWLSVGL